MRKLPITGLLLILSLYMVSCIKDSFDPEKCLQKLRIEFQWINSSPLDDSELIPLEIRATSGDLIRLISPTQGIDTELLPGIYNIVESESASNIIINGTTVSVSTQPDGLINEPGAFSGGAISLQVYSNRVFQVLTVPMRQQRRQLIVQLKVTGAGAQSIRTVDGTLDGIAISRDINNGFSPADGQQKPPAITNGTVKYTFQDGGNQNFSGGYYLLGVDGTTQQNLNLTVNTSLGIVKDFSLDVTNNLAEFHTKEVEKPWYIVLELNLDASLEFTITDWKTGTESNLVAQ